MNNCYPILLLLNFSKDALRKYLHVSVCINRYGEVVKLLKSYLDYI
jgi:hypothetical protein